MFLPSPFPHSRHFFLQVGRQLIFDDLPGSNCESRTDISVRVISLDGLVSEQFLLALDVGQVATDKITVFFGLEGGDQVDAGPHLLAGEFSSMIG